MKKILLVVSMLNIVLMAEADIKKVAEEPFRIYISEEIDILKKNGMSNLDLENIGNPTRVISKEGLVIIEKSKEEMINKVNEVSKAIIVNNEALDREMKLTDRERFKINIMNTYSDITEESFNKFIMFNYIGKVSFAVERDIIFKDIPVEDLVSRNEIKKGDIEKIVNNELKDREEFITEILKTFNKKSFDDIIENYESITKSFSLNFSEKEIKLIEKIIRKEIGKKL